MCNLISGGADGAESGGLIGAGLASSGGKAEGDSHGRCLTPVGQSYTPPQYDAVTRKLGTACYKSCWFRAQANRSVVQPYTGPEEVPVSAPTVRGPFITSTSSSASSDAVPATSAASMQPPTGTIETVRVALSEKDLGEAVEWNQNRMDKKWATEQRRVGEEWQRVVSITNSREGEGEMTRLTWIVPRSARLVIVLTSLCD